MPIEILKQWQVAVEAFDEERIAKLLKQHPDLSGTPIFDRRRDGTLSPTRHVDPLVMAASAGELKVATMLVESGATGKQIEQAIKLAQPSVAVYLLDVCPDGQPNIELMSYMGHWQSLKFWFDRGHQPLNQNSCQLLHNACCGRPGFRGQANDHPTSEYSDKYRNTVRVLIEAGVDVNGRNSAGNVKWDGSKPWRTNRETPLHFAAGNWDLEIIQQLIDAGSDRRLTNELGESPFDWAIRYSAPLEVVWALNFEGNPRHNPDLVWAANQGELSKVKEMIEAGADPNSVDVNGMGTLLNFHPEVTKYLLDHGANPDVQRNENILPVLTGVAGFNTACVKLMLTGGADANRSSEYNGETALHHAVCGDDVELVAALLEAGANPNQKSQAGKTTYMLWRDARTKGESPLHRAAAFGTPQVIQLLLDNGGDPSQQDKNKDTPLSWASWHARDKAVIDQLFYEGAGVGPDYPKHFIKDYDKVSAKARSGESNVPRNDDLVAAALAGNLSKVKGLIEAGADPNSVDANGMGPLLNFHPQVTKYLLEKGANPDVQRNENIMPVISGVSANKECVRLMLDAGADVNRASDHNGETLLHFAASGDDLELIRMALNAGANPNAQTIPGMKTFSLWRDARVRGETPLHRAAAWGSDEVIQMLIDAGADLEVRDAHDDTPLSWGSWYRRDKSMIDLLAYEGATVGPDIPPSENIWTE